MTRRYPRQAEYRLQLNFTDMRYSQGRNYRFVQENGWAPYGDAWWPSVEQAHLALEAALAGVEEYSA